MAYTTLTAIVRGDTAIYDLAITSNGVPLDLAGALIWFTAKHRRTDADSAAIFQKRSDTGGIVVNAPTTLGTAVVTLNAIDTVSLSAAHDVNLWFDVKIRDANGVQSTPIYGYLPVVIDVTNNSS